MTPEQMHTSTKIGRALEKALGIKARRFTVKMRGVKEASRFIRTVERAHKEAGNSTQRFRTTEQGD